MFLKLMIIGFGRSDMETSGGLDCGRKMNTSSITMNAMDARVIKMERHPKAAATKLPALGASIGDRLMIRIRNEMIEALFPGG